MKTTTFPICIMHNQFGCQDPTFTMGDMLATLPRGGQSMSGSSLPSQELAAGAQISGGFSRGNQDDPRCNGTLRKQASPRSNTLGSAHTHGQGGGEETSGQRYSADPTGLLSERGEKGDKDGYMASKRNKNTSDHLHPVEENPFVTRRRNGDAHVVIDGASCHTLHIAGAAAAPMGQSAHGDDEYINEPLYLNTFLSPGDKNGLAGAISISGSSSSTAQSVLQTANPSTSSHIVSSTGYVVTPGLLPHPTYPSHTLHPGHSGHTLHSGISSSTMAFDKKAKKATFDNPEYWQHSLPPKSTLHNPEYLQDCSTRFFYRQNGRIRPAVAENQEYLSEAAMKAGNVLPPPPYRQRNTVPWCNRTPSRLPPCSFISRLLQQYFDLGGKTTLNFAQADLLLMVILSTQVVCRYIMEQNVTHLIPSNAHKVTARHSTIHSTPPRDNTIRYI
ncbi:hypothetical protein CCH79_00002907 [Gambusia affinis]|uniref:Uncharacterized protein n=1 Tax=Gambusia affinis TaxID=33528 RepID=A0A315W6B1_GAMAF|nr:hypothetical protein CCH79_00002907 [Gambusia affinis]